MYRFFCKRRRLLPFVCTCTILSSLTILIFDETGLVKQARRVHPKVKLNEISQRGLNNHSYSTALQRSASTKSPSPAQRADTHDAEKAFFEKQKTPTSNVRHSDTARLQGINNDSTNSSSPTTRRADTHAEKAFAVEKHKTPTSNVHIIATHGAAMEMKQVDVTIEKLPTNRSTVNEKSDPRGLAGDREELKRKSLKDQPDGPNTEWKPPPNAGKFHSLDSGSSSCSPDGPKPERKPPTLKSGKN